MVEKCGLLFVLVESSSVMQRDMILTQPSGMSQHIPRAEMVVAAISRFLQNLGEKTDLGVVIGGYSLDDNDHVRLTSRTGEATSEFVAERLSTIVATPLEVKSVSRSSQSGTVSQQIPVHLRLGLSNAKASQAQAFAAAQSVLASLNPSVATIINICCSESAGANPQQIVEQIMQSSSGTTQIINVHLGTGSDVAIKYPSRKLALRGLARQLFSRTSDVSPGLATCLKELKQNTLASAKSLIVNASMVDLSELLSAVSKDIVAAWPTGELSLITPTPVPTPVPIPIPTPVPDPEPSRQQSGTNVLFVIGTGVENPYSDEAGIAVRKLLDIVNETIESASELNATISYLSITKDSDGDVEVSNSFPGDTAQSLALPAAGIREVAIDSVETIESISDGAGGLIEVPKKRSVFVRAEPSLECGFAAFLPSVTESISSQNSAKQILVLFFPGLPTADDLLAIESLKVGRELTILGCVQTIAAHPPTGMPQKDTSRIQDLGLVRLADCCQVAQMDSAPVFALCINSSRGLLKILQEVTTTGV